MNNKIKEKLALHRIIFAAGVLSIIGLVSWTYQNFTTYGLTMKFLESAILTIFFILVNILYYLRLSNLIKKLQC